MSDEVIISDSIANYKSGIGSQEKAREKRTEVETIAAIRHCYRQILERDVDDEGLESYKALLSENTSIFEVVVRLICSNEHAHRQRPSAKIASSILNLALAHEDLSGPWISLLRHLASGAKLDENTDPSIFNAAEIGDGVVGCAHVQSDGSLTGWAINLESPYSPLDILIQSGSRRYQISTTGGIEGIAFTAPVKMNSLLASDIRVTAHGKKIRVSTERPSIVSLLATHMTADQQWLWSCLCENNPHGRIMDSSALDLHTRSGQPNVTDFMLYLYAQRFNKPLDTESFSEVSLFLEQYIVDIRESWDSRNPFPASNELISYLQESAFSDGMSAQHVSRLLFIFWKRHFQDKKFLFDRECHRQLLYKLVSSPNAGMASFLRVCGERLLAPLKQRHPQSGRLPVGINWYWHFALSEELKSSNLEEVDPLKYLAAVFRKLFYCLASGNHIELMPEEWVSFWSQAEAGSSISRAEHLLSVLLLRRSFEHVNPEQWLNNVFYKRFPQFRILSAHYRRTVPVAPPYPEVLRLTLQRAPEANRLYVVGHTNQTGLGANLWMSIDAIKRMGLEPVVVSVDSDSLEIDSNAIAKATPIAKPTILFHVNADRAPLEVARLPSGLQQSAYRIGFFLWETSSPPPTHLLGLDLMDEIWVPTEYLASIYRKLTDKPVINVRKGLAAPPRVPAFPRSSLGITDADTVFLTIGDFHSSIPRKNPLATVMAFRRAFPERHDVKLILKIRNIDYNHWSNGGKYWEKVEAAIAGDSRIIILDRDLSQDDYWSLIKTSDAFVSLHKSEGFGYGIAHSLLLEKPVIVTDYSGSKDFCNESTAFLVPMHETPVAPHEMPVHVPDARWAEADISVAAKAMRAVLADKALALRKARAGRELICSLYSIDKLSETYSKRLLLLEAQSGKI